MHVIEWRNGNLRFLDQTRLPHHEHYIETDDPAVVVQALKDLALLGAPLIGIAAAYALVLAARRGTPGGIEGAVRQVDRWADALLETRPTAVNLRWAVDRMKRILTSPTALSQEDVEGALLSEARLIHSEDAAMCDAIARHGQTLLKAGSRVITHCNTGALATGGHGTALGIIKLGWKEGRVSLVYVDETRPLLQGSRLTAWELKSDGVPFRLITDSAGASLMRQGRVDAVLVGADRIARNGDIANKVGTYSLAVAAAHHGVPFVVAAPSSTLDLTMEDGSQIPIEERSGDEIIRWGGDTIAPEGSDVYAPAFDVTPGTMISAIVTERGVVRPPLDASLHQMFRTPQM